MTKHITTPLDLREMADDCERFNNTPPIQAQEYERLYLRITRYASRYLREAAQQIEGLRADLETRRKYDVEVAAGIERLRAALTRYGKHDSAGMSDQPGCQKTRMGGGPCTCGLEEAMR